MDKLRPFHSNELESLLECIRMIGGSKEYQQALVLAAYVKLFKDELVVNLSPFNSNSNYFSLEIRFANDFSRGWVRGPIPLKYKWMFEEDTDGKSD